VSSPCTHLSVEAKRRLVMERNFSTVVYTLGLPLALGQINAGGLQLAPFFCFEEHACGRQIVLSLSFDFLVFVITVHTFPCKCWLRRLWHISYLTYVFAHMHACWPLANRMQQSRKTNRNSSHGPLCDHTHA
jgi:hypothetical protein